jgi:hypothetical protein
MKIAYWIIPFLLSTWFLVSLFTVAYWFFHPMEWFWSKHKSISTGIAIGAFFGCFIVIGSGVRYLLWFIPKHWMWKTEEGEIMLVVSSIASLIGFGVAVFLSILFEKVQKMRRENRDLCTEIAITREIERRKKEELDFFEKGYVKKAAAEFRQKLEEIEVLAETDNLRPAQEIERRVLLGLLNELEWRLESLMELENGEDEQSQ